MKLMKLQEANEATGSYMKLMKLQEVNEATGSYMKLQGATGSE